MHNLVDLMLVLLGRMTCSCARPLATAGVRQQLSIHEELVHITVEVSRLRAA